MKRCPVALVAILISAALIAVVACVPATSSPAPTSAPTVQPNTGKLNLTAFAYYPPKNTPKFVLTVKSIEAQLWTSRAKQTEWVTLAISPLAFDLAIAGTQHSLAIGNLPPGDYVETRVILEKLLVSVDGQDVEIPLPNSTYYLGTPFGIVTGEETVVTINFDVQNFQPTRRGSIVQFQPYANPPFPAVLLTTRDPAEWPYKTPWWHRTPSPRLAQS